MADFEEQMKKKEQEFQQTISSAYGQFPHCTLSHHSDCHITVTPHILSHLINCVTEKGQTEDAKMAEELDSLRATLSACKSESEQMIDDKERQISALITEYEEKLNALAETSKQRETELIAQVCMTLKILVFETSRTAAPFVVVLHY